jgi:hypothetical protein
MFPQPGRRADFFPIVVNCLTSSRAIPVPGLQFKRWLVYAKAKLKKKRTCLRLFASMS